MKIYRISSEPKQMKKNKYNFHKLDQETKKDWFTVSSNCSYAWLDVKNEKIISNKILDSTFTNLVIYNNNKTPVAIYSSRRIVKRKILFLTFRVLESHFNGLFIADQYHHLFGDIRVFFLENVLNFIRYETKVDVIEHFSPPSLSVMNPHLMLHQSLPTAMNLSKHDSFVSFDLNNSILETLKSNVRNEVRRGIKTIEENNYLIITDKDKISFDDIYALDKYKSEKLKIEQLDKHHLENIYNDDAYELYLVKNNIGEPIVITIIEVFGDFSIFHYNSSNVEQDRFINKALMYKILEDQKQKMRKYFLLGLTNTGNTGIDYFKRSMSNTQFFLLWNYTSLSLKGILYSSKLIIKQILCQVSKRNERK